jgi:hypothetical protein
VTAKPSPRGSGRAALAALVLLLAVTTAGCSLGGGRGRQDDRDARNKAESDGIAKTLSQLPGVLRVDGGYTRDLSNAGGAEVLSITVRPGTDLQRVAGEAVRLTWLSRLDPITATSVTVGPADQPNAAIDRHADFKFDKDQLTAQYGPRPTSN